MVTSTDKLMGQETDKLTFTIGITEGYFHNNEKFVYYYEYLDNSNKFISLLKKCSSKIEKEYGIYISLNIIPSITLYKEEWGCPTDGENTYTISAIRNPYFNPDIPSWRKAAVALVKLLKKELKQSTVIAEFSQVDMLYLNNEN